jgi:hypothetical protein
MKVLRYQIIVQGIIDAGWSVYFSGTTITIGQGGVTRLCTETADQSALHGLLNRVRDLNLRLIAVQLLDDEGVVPVACRYCPRRRAPKNKPLTE